MSRRARLIRAATHRCGRVARRDRAAGWSMTMDWIAAADDVQDFTEMASIRLVRRWGRR